jgi:hypothetical protein
MNDTPPMGVIIPIARTPVNASPYRLPEKITMPASISHPAHERALPPSCGDPTAAPALDSSNPITSRPNAAWNWYSTPVW